MLSKVVFRDLAGASLVMVVMALSWLLCCNLEPGVVVIRTELLSSPPLKSGGCVPWERRTGEVSVVVVFRPLSSPVFCGSWQHSKGVDGGLTGLSCEDVLVMEILASPAGWWCGKTGAVMVIILDFL